MKLRGGTASLTGDGPGRVARGCLVSKLAVARCKTQPLPDWIEDGAACGVEGVRLSSAMLSWRSEVMSLAAKDWADDLSAHERRRSSTLPR